MVDLLDWIQTGEGGKKDIMFQKKTSSAGLQGFFTKKSMLAHLSL